MHRPNELISKLNESDVWKILDLINQSLIRLACLAMRALTLSSTSCPEIS